MSNGIRIAMLCCSWLPGAAVRDAVNTYDLAQAGNRFAYSETVPALALLPAVNMIPEATLMQADASTRPMAPDGQQNRDGSDPQPAGGTQTIPACSGTSTVPALVTVQTSGPGGQSQHFAVRVTNQPLLDQMIDICNGLSPQWIVTGNLVTGNGGYNQDVGNGLVWSWHMVEDSLALAESTIELCDGLPIHVEDNLQYWIETVTTFCPWSGVIIAVDADTSIAGDFNIDGVVGQADYLLLEGCFAGAGSACFNAAAGCCAPDMDADTDIDCADGDLFQLGWTAPGTPPVLPQCALGVPCVTEWGLVCMTLMLLVAASIIMHRPQDGPTDLLSEPSPESLRPAMRSHCLRSA